MKNLYCILGVRPQASAEELKSAYRRCAREAHPDRSGNAETFHEVQAAYALLSDPDQRARYDAERRAWMAKVGALECQVCGHASRLLSRPQAGLLARCWHCKTPLVLREEQLRDAERQAFAREVARLIDTVGADLADLAVDGVRLGLGRLRRMLGLSRGPRETT